ncbi:MAG: PBP1A family penicillin-binding protein [Deltaproteobacteria bacterium]|nr:PBP1A family penicillin-binding protein [Deltaproteobacteria bacterium]MBN2671007.1 PBP1A family penicillin-binding protein [Deltaproteobacteria bacterium]
MTQKTTKSFPASSRTKKNDGVVKKRFSVKKLIIRLLIVGLFLGIGAVAGLASVFYYYSLDLPAIGPLLRGYDPPQTTRIFAADGTLIGELFVERRDVVPVEKMPDVMLNAVIAAEDADFRNHEGIDFMGIARAAIRNVTSGELSQGASTITQQVARTFFLTREKSFSRKMKEMLLTRRIEQELTKNEILYLYLNQINFGHARYGVGEAARFYFDKDISELTLSEAALLAGIPKGPAIYEPIGHPEKATARRAYVLGQMRANGYISRAEEELAVSTPLGLKESKRNRGHFVPEVLSSVLEELEGVASLDELKRGRYSIWTSIDLDLQRQAREAMVNGLVQIDARHTRVAPFKKRRWPDGDRGKDALRMGNVYVGEVTGTDDKQGALLLDLGGRPGVVKLEREARYNPKNLPASEAAEIGAKLRVELESPPREGKPLDLKLSIGPQGAVVVLEPKTGYILAVVGSDRAVPGGFNRAQSAMRQPGSSFKPFVYLEALRQRKYTLASMLDDSPEVDGEWKPQNSHGDEFKGRVSIRDALAQSMNLPAIKLIRDVGPEKVAALAQLLGIDSKLTATPSLALGTSEVTPMEMAVAYGTIASQGIRRGPWMVKRVVGPDGREVPLVGRIGKPVLAREEAYAITALMTSVIKNGTGSQARSLKLPLAGKTGTTDNAKDAWFVGFSPEVTTAVWVGYDEPRTLGKREYGSNAALPIWMEVMRAAHRKRAVADFEMPAGIVEIEIDPASGLLAYEGMEHPVTEIFIEGTEPTEEALPEEVVSLDSFMIDQAAALAGEIDSDTAASDADNLTPGGDESEDEPDADVKQGREPAAPVDSPRVEDVPAIGPTDENSGA